MCKYGNVRGAVGKVGGCIMMEIGSKLSKGDKASQRIFWCVDWNALGRSLNVIFSESSEFWD